MLIYCSCIRWDFLDLPVVLVCVHWRDDCGECVRVAEAAHLPARTPALHRQVPQVPGRLRRLSRLRQARVARIRG